MIGYAFILGSLLCCLFAIVRGGWEERVVAVTFYLGAWNTRLIYIHHDRDFLAAQWALFANEAAMLAIYLFVAFRSKRFWPLFTAALEVPPTLAFLTPLFGDNIVSYGLGVTQGIWAYPQLAILVLATIRRNRRMKRGSSPG